jgi:hypothetical protein
MNWWVHIVLDSHFHDGYSVAAVKIQCNSRSSALTLLTGDGQSSPWSFVRLRYRHLSSWSKHDLYRCASAKYWSQLLFSSIELCAFERSKKLNGRLADPNDFQSKLPFFMTILKFCQSTPSHFFNRNHTANRRFAPVGRPNKLADPRKADQAKNNIFKKLTTTCPLIQSRDNQFKMFTWYGGKSNLFKRRTV